MPADGTQIKQDINNDLGNKGYRGVRTFMIIATLIKVVDWITGVVNGNLSTWLKTSDGQPGGANTDSVYRIGKAIFGRNYSNGTGATLEASTAWIDMLNGNRVSPWFTITQPGDNLGGTQYYAICELAAQSGGTYDYAQIEFMGKFWDTAGSGPPIELSLWIGNRGGFRYHYTTRGDGQTNGTGLICQQMPDGRTVVYMVTDNSFKAISARVTSSIQTIVYDTAIYKASLVGLGNEVFNSTKPTVYRPIWALRSRFSALTIANSDGAWPAAPISEGGSGQLTIGANSVPGSSEVSLMNSNLVGGGFSFWQQTGAAAKKMLAFLNASGNLILTGRLVLPSNTANRKLTLYDTTDNDHQFYGFGIDPGGLRYQVDGTAARHTFYAGDSALTSKELMRLLGDGKLLIGYTTANDRDLLQVNGPISGKINKQSSNPTAGETPVDSWRVVKVGSEVRLWVNDNGTMKSTLLS